MQKGVLEAEGSPSCGSGLTTLLFVPGELLNRRLVMVLLKPIGRLLRLLDRRGRSLLRTKGRESWPLPGPCKWEEGEPAGPSTPYSHLVPLGWELHLRQFRFTSHRAPWWVEDQETEMIHLVHDFPNPPFS